MAVSENIQRRSDLQMEEPGINSSRSNDGESIKIFTTEPRLQFTTKLRNLSAFWLLGLCNNFSYVVMLSAAHDILAADFNPSDNKTIPTVLPLHSNDTRDCNKMSTGAILLADVLPSLCIKMIAPFIGINTTIRIILVVGLCAASLITVALSTAHWVTFLGVACASLSGGLGETTFLGYSAYFDRNVVSTWSSGTGGSGIFGALSYAAMTTAGISSRTTILIMLIIPIMMAFRFQVDYQLGVFLSRSSVNLFTINKLWLLPILQFLNVMFFLAEMFYPFIPSIWIVFGLILFEGLLGGAAYVNTYYKMAKEVPPQQRSFSMAFVPLADSFGVALAGAIALPVHDYFCRLPLPT